MKLLICGTRGKDYDYGFVGTHIYMKYGIQVRAKELIIIEGCCPNSADELAERFAKEAELEIKHFPSTSRNYLKRNIEMVEECDEVLAFWDGFSYGTAHAIAQAVLKDKPVNVVRV